MNILKEFKKDLIVKKRKSSDKISITPLKINFLSGFIVNNNLHAYEFVNVYVDAKERRIAFVFNNNEGYKLRKTASPNYKPIALGKKILKDLKMKKNDFKKYTYKKHVDSGKEIYIIQLRK